MAFKYPSFLIGERQSLKFIQLYGYALTAQGFVSARCHQVNNINILNAIKALSKCI